MVCNSASIMILTTLEFSLSMINKLHINEKTKPSKITLLKPWKFMQSWTDKSFLQLTFSQSLESRACLKVKSQV